MTQGRGWRRLLPDRVYVGYLHENTFMLTEAAHPPDLQNSSWLHPPACNKNEQGIEKSHMVKL